MQELDKERRQKGIKQQVLCSQIGISTKTYSSLMRGDCNRLDVFLAAQSMIYYNGTKDILPCDAGMYRKKL